MPYRWRCCIALAVLFILGVAAAHLRIDDSLIYARYIRNALAGHGLVFNWTPQGGGEKVNALTSPLYTYLLLALSWILRGHVLVAQWVLGMALLAVTVALAERQFPFAGIFVAGAIYFEIMLGMETPLYALLLLLSVTLYADRQWNWLPLTLYLLLLARFEGGLLAALIFLQMFRRRVWPRWPWFAPAIAVFGIYLGLNFWFYGQALPSSASAKFYHAMSGYWGRWPTAFLRFEMVTLHPLKKFAVLLPLIAWLAWRGGRSEKLRQWNPVALPFCTVLLAFYIFANLPGYPWYLAPFVLFALVYAAAGMPRSRTSQVMALLIVSAACVAGSVGLRRSAGAYEQYRTLAAWLNQNALPGATIAATETGTLGWYCDHPIVDIAGLTTPENARLLAHHDPSGWLRLAKPDYVVVHQPPMIGEQAAIESADYTRVGPWLPAELDSTVPRPATYLLQRIK